MRTPRLLRVFSRSASRPPGVLEEAFVCPARRGQRSGMNRARSPATWPTPHPAQHRARPVDSGGAWRQRGAPPRAQAAAALTAALHAHHAQRCQPHGGPTSTRRCAAAGRRCASRVPGAAAPAGARLAGQKRRHSSLDSCTRWLAQGRRRAAPLPQRGPGDATRAGPGRENATACYSDGAGQR
jgi:hypothetical protein